MEPLEKNSMLEVPDKGWFVRGNVVDRNDLVSDLGTSLSYLTSKTVLYVIAVVSNPAQFKRRYQLFLDFCDRMKKEPQVRLVTVELQNGNRPFATNSTLKFRTKYELWYKENLVNIAVKHLPSDWEYMAWIDADIEFVNPNWVFETIDKLQTYKIVQLFSHAVDLGVHYETLQVHMGFMYQYWNLENFMPSHQYGNTWHHPGYAWAITRAGYNSIGGLLDFAILGSADTHMALSFVGLIEKSLNKRLHPNYKTLCMNFQKLCTDNIRKSVGYVTGTILHYFHGDKQNRKYVERWRIIVENEFDPLADIHKDCHDLWQLDESKIKLRDDIIRYFRARNEDENCHRQDYKYKKSEWI